MAESALAQLQDRLFRVTELFQALRQENAGLKGEIQQIKQDLEELTKEIQLKSQRMKQFEQDRLRIQSRADRILKNVATLEDRTGG